MDKKIGMYGSIINLTAVVLFAAGMVLGALTGDNFLAYFSSAFIAFGYVPMACAYCYYSKNTAGYCSAVFAAIYAAFSLLALYPQLTVVRFGNLSKGALQVLDYQNFGLFFNYDLLCYCFMAISTFFAGLTINIKTKGDKVLKQLLIIHGIFALSCFIMPMFKIFNADQSSWIGVGILLFWCVYFIPVGILSFIHFKNMQN